MSLFKKTSILLLMTLPLSARDNTDKGLSQKEIDKYMFSITVRLNELGGIELENLLPIAARACETQLVQALLNYNKTHTWMPINLTQEIIDKSLLNACLKLGYDNDNKTKKALKEIIYALLKAGANPNTKAGNGDSVLLLADSSTEIMQILMNFGANPNMQDEHQKTLLMSAAEYFAKNAVAILLSHGANVNLQDRNGDTALHFAIHSEKNTDIIKLLLQAGANKNISNNQGITPLQKAHNVYKNSLKNNYVIANDHSTIIKLLS